MPYSSPYYAPADPQMPADMTEVSKEEFFTLLYLYDTKRDVMPSHMDPHFTVWQTWNRVVYGWSIPGWKNPGGPAKFGWNSREVKNYRQRQRRAAAKNSPEDDR